MSYKHKASSCRLLQLYVFTVPYNLLIPCWWGGIPWVCVHTAEVCVPTCCTLHCQSSSWVQAGLFTASDGEGALSGTGRGCDVGTVTLGSVTRVLTTAVSTPRCFPLVKNFTLLLYFCWILFCFKSVFELLQLLFNPGDDCIPLQHYQLVDYHLPFRLDQFGADKLVFGMCAHAECTLAFWPYQV